MKLPNEVSDMVLSADSKALATTYKDTVNVVPVSSIKIVDDKIWLINYFMDKTLKNISHNPRVALVCWKGLSGYQIKAEVTYVTEGDAFAEAKQWIAKILPERIVQGLLILQPTEIFDISASKDHVEYLSYEHNQRN